MHDYTRAKLQESAKREHKIQIGKHENAQTKPIYIWTKVANYTTCLKK